jgi:hypothetical protein
LKIGGIQWKIQAPHQLELLQGNNRPLDIQWDKENNQNKLVFLLEDKVTALECIR